MFIKTIAGVVDIRDWYAFLVGINTKIKYIEKKYIINLLSDNNQLSKVYKYTLIASDVCRHDRESTNNVTNAYVRVTIATSTSTGTQYV